MTNTTPSAMAPAGWYTDPSDGAQERYWDGAAWTDQVRFLGAPAMMPAPPSEQPVASTSNRYSIAGIILGILALLTIAPIIFGPVGLVLGAVGKGKGESMATAAMVVSGIGTVVGLTLAFIIAIATL